jgi:hypothetical protein
MPKCFTQPQREVDTSSRVPVEEDEAFGHKYLVFQHKLSPKCFTQPQREVDTSSRVPVEEDEAFGHKYLVFQHKLSPKCFIPTSLPHQVKNPVTIK